MADQTECEEDPRKKSGAGSSLGTQFIVLTQIADMPEACDVATIAGAAGLSQSTVRRAINQLQANGLVSTAVGGGYILGEASVRLGQKLRSMSRLERLAQPVLHELAQQTNETTVVNRYLPDEGTAIIAGLAESSRLLSYRIEIGELKYLHTGASGKVIMAFLPSQTIDSIIERHGLPSLTDRTIINRDQLKHDLRIIRSQGYGISRGERVPGAVALAAPLFGAGRQVVGSLVVTIPEHRFDETRKDNFIDRLVGSAAGLSDQLAQS